MITSKSVAKLAKALIQSQAELPDIDRNKSVKYTDEHGQAHQYRYATLSKIISVVRPVLARNGLALVLSVDKAEASHQGDVADVSVTRLQHISGEFMEHAVPILPMRTDAQGFGTAMTYASRYGINAILCLSTDGDTDAETALPREITDVDTGSARMVPGTQPSGGPIHPDRKERAAAPLDPAAQKRAGDVYKQLMTFHEIWARLAWNAPSETWATKLANIEAVFEMVQSFVGDSGRDLMPQSYTWLDNLADNAKASPELMARIFASQPLTDEDMALRPAHEVKPSENTLVAAKRTKLYAITDTDQPPH